MLDVHAICVQLGGRTILNDVSLALEPGQVLAVLGPNGAGKSTLLRAISGLLPLCAGEIRVAGKQLARLSSRERARLISVVPQTRSLPPGFSVYDTVMLGRAPHLNWQGRAGQQDHARVRAVLEAAQLSHLAQRFTHELSGGEQQRVLLARAMAQDTPLMLLDEPTTYLDLQHQTEQLNLVRSLAEQCQVAVLMVLHDPNLASLYADRLLFLVEGQVRAAGAAVEVLNADLLSDIYHIPVTVIPHPDTGAPLVLPDGRYSRPFGGQPENGRNYQARATGSSLNRTLVDKTSLSSGAFFPGD